MQLFLALLLLATIWTCEAFYLAKVSNAGWEEDFEKYLLEAVDFDVASQDNSPHHTLASSPTTLHTSNSHHQHHLYSHSSVPIDSIHHSTGSNLWEAPVEYSPNPSDSPLIMREAPTYSFPTSLKPHLPSSSSSSEFVPGFGLPINFFTKNFFKEAAHSKGIHQGLLDKILTHFGSPTHFGSLKEDEEVKIGHDSQLWEASKSFRSIKSNIKDTGKLTAQSATYFIKSSATRMDYWKKRTQIRLDDYVRMIESSGFKDIFPLYLFYIEFLTMILPKKPMEELDARCKFFVDLANAAVRLPVRVRDAELSEIAHSLSRKAPKEQAKRSTIAWAFVFAWAKKYRPEIFITEMKQAKPQLPTNVTSFINALVSCTVKELTEQVERSVAMHL
ncbi:hypothetical protein PCANC_01527 [Puccinia coronata f. sp. avenae]|uniref:Uncharacterized protein n=2 Tax=Puccinia coronata f. sp. avenae TaxID=200324 RepID=A0A2N5W2Q3_9BASI|nr:hypothetical protein PCANC_20866 [Puccinia coronata f. sp. avenae]PLW56529.1 hypothetical protein PCANC_01527 [Puccinia coronata f. sp. avenae]